MAWIDDIKARIDKYVLQQGNQTGLEGLAGLLNDMADKVNDSDGGGDLSSVGIITLNPQEYTEQEGLTVGEIAEILGTTIPDLLNLIYDNFIGIYLPGLDIVEAAGGVGYERFISYNSPYYSVNVEDNIWEFYLGQPSTPKYVQLILTFDKTVGYPYISPAWGITINAPD